MTRYQNIIILSSITLILGLILIFTPMLSSNQDNLNYYSVVSIHEVIKIQVETTSCGKKKI